MLNPFFPPLAGLFAMIAAGLPPTSAGEVSPAPPVIPARVFKLADYGAVADGRTPNTAAFKRAIAAVNGAGGGTLDVPRGRYCSGPIDLCSGLNLRLESGATLLFSRDPNDYRIGSGRFRPLMEAVNAHDVMLSGNGTIDGGGDAWWDDALKFKAAARARGSKSDTSPRPRMVVFSHCQRVRVEGITLINSPVFNLLPIHCEDVAIENVTILNPADSPNTDGIDPSASRNVLISHCLIDTGDDCIAIKAGDGPVRGVLITDCTFLHGHGCSIGSETKGGISDVTVRRCAFEDTDMGVRLKSARGRGGLVDNVVYTDLTMKNVGQAIVISSYYYDEAAMPGPGRHAQAVPTQGAAPVWRHIVLRNISATGCLRNAGLVVGLPESPVADLILENLAIESPIGLRIGYASRVTLSGVSVTAAEGPPLIVDDTVEQLSFSK